MKKNLYITAMFPYPSGSGLHVGHWYNYAVADSYCKVQKWLGHEVYQPFGYDSFGLPAENYARKVGRDPLEVTEENIAAFRTEMQRMGTGFVEKLCTHSPAYQAKTRAVFALLLRRGLAYKAKRAQDYCPSCETVLAKEQAAGGACERCGTAVEQRELEQWFFRITAYKQRLIDDLDRVDYPEKTKKQQRHWLENLTDWCVSRQRKWGCPIPVAGEGDTLDTFVDSAFYTVMYDPTRPVDIYVGGNEHACMHLIYARFITKVMFDAGFISFDEPFRQVVHQGMILKDGEKMSKSKGNTIDPGQYDPQELRMYLMFINHYFDGGSWSDANFRGVQKFIKRFKRWTAEANEQAPDVDVDGFFATAVSYMEAWKVNKVVSEWMTFYNRHKNARLNVTQRDALVKFFEACF